MSASPMVSLRSPRILVVPLLLALGSAVTAQGIERPPHPGLGVVTGSHVFALEFVDEAFDASRCADVARRIQVEEPLLSPGLVGVAIRTRESFSAKAKEGGLPGNRHSEVMEWVVRGEKDYLIHVRPGGNHARSSPVASVRTLYRDGLKIYRADRDGVEPSAATFFVDDEVESYSDCPLFAEWEVHARMVAYCLDSGAAGSNDLVVVSAAVVASAPPIQVPFDSQTDSYTLLREWVEGVTRFRISAYDAQGRVCREWSSTWFQGEPRQLLSRSYVAFTQDLLSTRDFRLLSRDPDAQLPDFAQITSLPFDRDAARDFRTEVPYVFDPRRGLPERPKTMAAITEERIQKLRRDRESGVRNKFTDNLDALDAAEGGMEPKVRMAPMPVEVALAVDSSAVRPNAIPVLPMPATESLWPEGLLATAAIGALGIAVWLVRAHRRARAA